MNPDGTSNIQISGILRTISRSLARPLTAQILTINVNIISCFSIKHTVISHSDSHLKDSDCHNYATMFVNKSVVVMA